jgi:hypothetical protein
VPRCLMPGHALMLPLLLSLCGASVHSAPVDTAHMWRELYTHCSAGRCRVGTGSKLDPSKNTTDCKGRLLAYEFGLLTIPARAPQLESFDALELQTHCGVTRPKARPSWKHSTPRLAMPRNGGRSYHVDPLRGDDAAPSAGSATTPFRTIRRALQAARGANDGSAGSPPPTMVLAAGTHYLNETISLGAKDRGMTITAAPGAEGKVVVSGGVPLSPRWTRSPRGPASANIWVTPVPRTITEIRGLTTLEPHRRVTRAREPNADPAQGAELCQHCWHNRVIRWHSDLSCIGKATTVYKDLRNCDAHGMLLPDSTSPCKNDSAMWNTYNTYSNGHGGCCAAWSGDHSPYGPMGNYFCGNSSAGGWVGHDDPRGVNKTQGLSAQLPYGFDYDPTDAENGGQFLATMKNASGAIFHVWRAQGWFVNMFEVASSSVGSKEGSVKFATTESYGVSHVKGGWQGVSNYPAWGEGCVAGVVSALVWESRSVGQR